MKFLYGTALGRLLLNILLKSGVLKKLSLWTHSPKSRWLIKYYIKKHRIDMKPFKGQAYESFADFFARKKEQPHCTKDSGFLISPCDGMMSIAPVNEYAGLKVKDIWYSLYDLIEDRGTARAFEDGICLIFRLRAKDYHHFCYIDDCIHEKRHDIPGMLHSVQPIALEREPVFRVNKRTWSVLNTVNFGKVVQIEVGAVLVGGIVHEKENEWAKRGEEMGHFELCGSTIILIFTSEMRKKLYIDRNIAEKLKTLEEYPVKMGETLGCIEG